MDVIVMIFDVVIVLSLLIFVHEGGHYLAARACGVRVTEFMLGLPGPSLGFMWNNTRFGITCVPLGGYARICGMEPGPENPHIKDALAFVYTKGVCTPTELAYACDLSDEAALEVLAVLDEWGCVVDAGDKDHPCYETRAYINKKEGVHFEQGAPRPFTNAEASYEHERAQTYRRLGFFKRSAILLAGIATNIVVGILLLVLALSVFGIDSTNASGEFVKHVVLSPIEALQASIHYLGVVAHAVIGLFNPSTAAKTVSDSTSIIGIAVMSKTYADAGIAMFLQFMAMISVSLGLMNLIPIPPLDGGRFLIEIIQAVIRRPLPEKIMSSISFVGIALFVLFFVFMMNQDIQRFIFHRW